MISQDAGIKWQDVQCDTELWTLLKYMYTQVRCHDFCSFITEFTGSVIGLPCVEYIKKADFAILLYLLFWYCQLSWKNVSLLWKLSFSIVATIRWTDIQRNVLLYVPSTNKIVGLTMVVTMQDGHRYHQNISW